MTCSSDFFSNIGKVLVVSSSTRPTGTDRYEGRLIYEFDTGRVLEWNGTNWVGLGREGYAFVTTSQGPITATTDLTGLTVTWDADPSRLYRTTWKTVITATAANQLALTYLTSAANTQVQRWLTDTGALFGGSGYATVHGTHVETGLSGSTTRKLRLERNFGAGTLSSYAAAAEPAFILVEDIGPA